jgi:hypothetical protein
MSNNDQPHDPLMGPLVPEAKDGLVVVVNPPEAPMHLTPDQADVSGVRLLDAADKARGDLHGKRTADE